MQKQSVRKSGGIFRQVACLLGCLMLMAVLPIWRDHKLLGFELPHEGREEVETIRPTASGYVVNTTELGKDIIGYVGPTPVEIYVDGDVISKIVPLPNQETPEYYGAVRNSDLFETLDGKTLGEAASAQIDGVSGATYTSRALIGNIRAGVAYALNHGAVAPTSAGDRPTLKFWATIAIILAGGVIPLFVRNRKYRVVQLILNVGVLGFWGGTFICYSLMTSYITNGIHSILLIPTALMLVTAFIYPLFGRKNYYCAWLCPYGSLQELAGKCIKFKLKISPRVLKGLNVARQVLWFVLMWLLWTGLWLDWMGYEPFAAFFFRDASVGVLVIAGVFVALSLVVQRPYCRFVCPTGTLFKYSEGSF